MALGDSYSAGEGAPLYLKKCSLSVFLPGTVLPGVLKTGTVGCHRSLEAWAATLGEQLKNKYRFSFHACSGAVINDFFNGQKIKYWKVKSKTEQPQSTWLQVMHPDGSLHPNRDIKLITFTFGGNDAGFADTLADCASPLTPRNDAGGRNPGGSIRPALEDGPCKTAILAAQKKITLLDGPAGSWEGHHTLVEFYAAVRAYAPEARVVVVGYPRFFPENQKKKCGGGGGRNFTRRRCACSTTRPDRPTKRCEQLPRTRGSDLSSPTSTTS